MLEDLKLALSILSGDGSLAAEALDKYEILASSINNKDSKFLVKSNKASYEVLLNKVVFVAVMLSLKSIDRMNYKSLNSIFSKVLKDNDYVAIIDTHKILLAEFEKQVEG